MQVKPFLILTLMLMGLLSLFSFCKGRGDHSQSVQTITTGPFTIQKRRIVEKRFDMNRGRVKSAYSRYKILYGDQPVTFPAALQVNTGYASVWKAFTLTDAPQPAIIAGSQSMYLITEEAGAASIRPINEQNSSFASIQWLDSENGQPGPKQEIYISEDTSANLALTGGSLLLVNGNTVLQLSDLAMYPFSPNLDYTDGYYPSRVVGFSPSREDIVVVGSKQSPERYDKFIYALLVYNFRNNTVYPVPFDQTATRLYLPDYITAEWIDTYFSWQSNPDGNPVLVKKQLTTLPHWQGIYSQDQTSYQLTPVNEGIVPALMNYIRSELSLHENDIKVNTYGEYKTNEFKVGEFVFEVGYMSELNSVSFYKSFMGSDDESFKEILVRIGDGFNRELGAGKHQEFFTTY